MGTIPAILGGWYYVHPHVTALIRGAGLPALFIAVRQPPVPPLTAQAFNKYERVLPVTSFDASLLALYSPNFWSHQERALEVTST